MPTPSVKLRTSCDRCQSHKIKCNQGKPECQRCISRGVACVYSPLKRMGRPKKQRTDRNHFDAQTGEIIISPVTATEALSTSTIPHIAAGPTSAGHQISTLVPEAVDPELADTMLNNDSPVGENVVSLGNTMSTAGDVSEVYFAHSPSHGAQTTISLVDNCSAEAIYEVPLNQGQLQSGSETRNRDLIAGHVRSFQDLYPYTISTTISRGTSDCPSLTLSSKSSELHSNGSIHTESPDIVRPTIDTTRNCDCKGQCYPSLLSHLTQLELSLAADSQPLIDFVLISERDLHALKDRLFACYAHNSINTGDSICRDACLRSQPSSLLVLSLYIGRVIFMLEDLFSRAAVYAHTMEQEARQAWLIYPVPSSSGEPPADTPSISQQSALRFERSVRSTFERNITCPIPESCELMLGNYRASGKVRTLAMKHILRRRIRKLAAMLGALRSWLIEATDAEPPIDNDMDGALMGRGSGRKTILLSTKNMVEDLHNRIESLQGRVELAN